MSENLKNTDGVFRKQLRDYSQSAPEDAWGNIDQALNKNISTKKFPFYKIAAALVAFAVVGSALVYFSSKSISVDNSRLIANTNVEELTDKAETNSKLNEIEAPIENAEIINDISESNKNVVVPNAKIRSVNIEDNTILVADIDKKEVYVKFNKLSHKNIVFGAEKSELVIIDNRKQKIKSFFNSLPDIYSSYALNEAIEIEKPKRSKWLVGGEFSPLYSYRNISETSSVYDKDFYNSTESPIISYTGGVNMQYKAISRLTIQTGVYYTTMGQSLDYMSVYANTAYDNVADEYKDRYINSYSIENSSGDLSFNSSHVIIDDKSIRVNNHSSSKGVADITDAIFNELDAEIQQSFQYIEVPVLLRYTLIDRNIDFNIIGGFGANFLIGNDVFINYSGNKKLIGETYGVSTVNYNGTIGFGIEYPIMNRLNIRLEPSIKYYINELNSSSPIESHPYSIGFYTGINYSF